MQYPLQREAGDDSDFVHLEVVMQLPQGHKKAEEQFLHTGVPRSSPLQEGTNKVDRVLHHFLLRRHFNWLRRLGIGGIGLRRCYYLIINFSLRH